MRIAYGVHGYSRGHATRALAVLPDLVRHYQVKVYAGGDAYDTLAGRFDVERIPTMRYCYRDGRRSTWRTLCHSFPLFLELLTAGPSVRALRQRLLEFAPDVVISDAESWTHMVARTLGIPRIGFDHFGMMVHCKLSLSLQDWFESLVDRGVYRVLTGRPDRVMVSSFYQLEPRTKSVEIIPPLLRDEVHRVAPSTGDHLLVYLNQGNVQLRPSLLRALAGSGRPVRCYGTGRRGRAGPVDYRPPSDEGFLRDLASCKAVVSTAGNQLVGEALRFGKPLLVMPERTVEQRLNARAVRQLGIGEVEALESLDASRLRDFLRRADNYARVAEQLGADGRQVALHWLHRWVNELGRTSRIRRLGPVRGARRWMPVEFDRAEGGS